MRGRGRGRPRVQAVVGWILDRMIASGILVDGSHVTQRFVQGGALESIQGDEQSVVSVKVEMRDVTSVAHP